MKARVALVVGHKSTSPGARSTDGITEFGYNTELALRVWRMWEDKNVSSRMTFEAMTRGLLRYGVELVLVWRRTYSTLAQDIRDTNASLAIELHCNAHNTEVSGTETLYYHRDAKSQRLAQMLQRRLVVALGLRDRGVHSITRSGRGGELLAGIGIPMVIAEPFFIDHDPDFKRALTSRDAQALAYINAIGEYLIGGDNYTEISHPRIRGPEDGTRTEDDNT